MRPAAAPEGPDRQRWPRAATGIDPRLGEVALTLSAVLEPDITIQVIRGEAERLLPVASAIVHDQPSDVPCGDAPSIPVRQLVAEAIHAGAPRSAGGLLALPLDGLTELALLSSWSR